MAIAIIVIISLILIGEWTAIYLLYKKYKTEPIPKGIPVPFPYQPPAVDEDSVTIMTDDRDDDIFKSEEKEPPL